MPQPPAGSLIAHAEAVCARLAPHGWADLLAQHGLNIRTHEDLRAELLRELQVDRSVPGFEDFALEGRRAIEPGDPARSLLFHALASPNVQDGQDGQELEVFPTGREIDAVENLVYGIEPRSLAEVAARFPASPLAVVVFATEYRPAIDTVHRRHADVCLARTGVARVGSAPPQYEPRARGYLPFVEAEEHAIRVLPAAYSPYLAVQLAGDREAFGPMNFDLARRLGEGDGRSDEDRLFWVPLHKLFSGRECLRGLDLRVTILAEHRNEKISRVHRELGKTHDTGWREPDIENPPFVFSEGIAELSSAAEDRPGLLVPIPHDRLVQAAEYRGAPLALRVPAQPDNDWSPSLTIPAVRGARHAPEYVHVRHAVSEAGAVSDLNDVPDVAERVSAGGYSALHYMDFSGDGWVEAVCPELASQVPRNIPAYSLVTAPDFYPSTSQRELIEWWVQRVPAAVRQGVWQTPPYTLSDERLAPNIQLPGGRFRAEDETPTAIVALPRGVRQQRPLVPGAALRSPHLPDAAAGVFAPGWDTGRDEADGVAHLAAHGLGSPFPEDAKLCAALSTFWPAVTPDAGRSFSQPFPTVAPLDDVEVGSTGGPPWDGIEGPRLADGDAVDYASFNHVDYVESALASRFSLARTGQVGTEEYTARILASYWAHRLAGIARRDRLWRVVSFRELAAGELEAGQGEAGATLPGARYLIRFGRTGRGAPRPGNHRRVRMELTATILVIAAPLSRALVKEGDGPWELRSE